MYHVDPCELHLAIRNAPWTAGERRAASTSRRLPVGSMKRKFRGKTCIYCAIPGISEDGDHVVCREFFLVRHRGNLPKVPACKKCNNTKGGLERYLTTVMLFGGRHVDATEALASMAAGRLRGNQKLAREIATGIEYAPSLDSSNHASMTAPFDSEQLRQLYEMIARGLAWEHWALLLPPDSVNVYGWFASPEGSAIFDKIFAQDAKRRVTRQLGKAFLYDGAQAKDPEQFTIWRMSLYGAVMVDEVHTPAQIGYVLTAPKSMAVANEFIRLLERVREPKTA